MKDNISKLTDCYGCGVCVVSCPVNIISLTENNDGFYSPIVEPQDKCIECGICLRVCSFNHAQVSVCDPTVKAYAAWSKDDEVRKRCSSGGISYEIGKTLIHHGYKAVGVRYDAETHRAEHYISFTPGQFLESRGSKYIQSNPVKAFGKIGRDSKYLVCGTPCQIDSFRRMIRLKNIERNFVLLDFFCHGVPSLLLWDKYISSVGKKIGKIISVDWRDKDTGWHDSWSMRIKPEGKDDKCDESSADYVSRYSSGDMFYRFFLGNYCLDKCCYDSCKYKLTASAADIRVGDFWGSKYLDDDRGVSSVLAITPEGDEVLKSIPGIELIEYGDVDVVLEGQMAHCPPMPPLRSRIIARLKSRASLSAIYYGTVKIYNLRFLPSRVIGKIKKFIGLR